MDSQLIGLNLLKGFRQAVKERLSGIAGCTHLTELASVLPTAAIQAFAGDVLPTRDGQNEDDQAHAPFQLGRCHALRHDGPAVAQFYPRWSVNPKCRPESLHLTTIHQSPITIRV